MDTRHRGNLAMVTSLGLALTDTEKPPATVRMWEIWNRPMFGTTLGILQPFTSQTDGTACVTNNYGHVPDNPNDYIKVNREYYFSAEAWLHEIYLPASTKNWRRANSNPDSNTNR